MIPPSYLSSWLKLSEGCSEVSHTPSVDETCQTVFQPFSSVTKVRVWNLHPLNPHMLCKMQPLTLARSKQQLHITYQNSLFWERKANEEVSSAFQSVSEQAKVRDSTQHNEEGIRRCLTQMPSTLEDACELPARWLLAWDAFIHARRACSKWPSSI